MYIYCIYIRKIENRSLFSLVSERYTVIDVRCFSKSTHLCFSVALFFNFESSVTVAWYRYCYCGGSGDSGVRTAAIGDNRVMAALAA